MPGPTPQPYRSIWLAGSRLRARPITLQGVTGPVWIMQPFDGPDTSNGATITTTNTGGDFATAPDTVSIGATGTAVFTSTSPYRGALAASLTVGGTTAQTFVEWAAAHGISSTGALYQRARVKHPVLPGSFTRFAAVTDSAGTLQAEWRLTSAGKIEQRNSAGTLLNTSTATISAGAWVDVGTAVAVFSATVGVIECVIFDAAGAVSETMTSAATQNTLQAGGLCKARVGILSNLASFTAQFDDWGVASDTYPALPLNGSTDATATPATIAPPAAALSGTAQAGAGAAPATLSRLVAIAAVTVTTGATATPATISRLVAVSGTAQAGVTVAPATLSRLVAVSGTAQAGATATPATIAPPVVVIPSWTDQLPTVPTGLTSTAIRSTEVDLTWNAATDDLGVIAYELTIAQL